MERFISAVKFLKLYSGKAFDMVHFEEEPLMGMNEMPTWVKQQDELNVYEGVLDKYHKYFSNVLFLSYENIIEDPLSVHRELETFLDLDIDVDRYQKLFSRKVNAIGKTGKISSQTRKILEDRYGKSTQFLENYFKNNRM